jgi:polyisoprenoid-binding protein YceI
MTFQPAARVLSAALLSGFAIHAFAAELTRIAPEKSAISFTSKQMGVPVEGRFGRFEAKLAVDPARPEGGRLQLDIDLASIDAGSREADEEVKSKNWFHVVAFPRASFVSTGVKALGGGKYEAVGKLTIKGATRDLGVPFTVKPDAGGALFEGGFILKRLQYKIGEGVWGDVDTVADDVQIRFRIYARN